MSRLIDADKLLEYGACPNDCNGTTTCAEDYEHLHCPVRVFDIESINDAPTVQAIIIPDNATNGDMVEKFFGKDVYCTLIRMMYSSCCEKLKKWWNAPYK